jgi:hypothetical protein
MAGPWEQFQAAPQESPQGPWAKFEAAPAEAKVEPRGVMDQLLGSTGPRYQLWPERAVREMIDAPRRLMETRGSAPPASREFTENLIAPAAQTALLFGPRVPKAGAPAAAASGIPSREALDQTSSQGFNAARNSGVEISPQMLTPLHERIAADLGNRGVIKEFAPDTFAAIDKIANRPAVPSGARELVTIGDLHNLRQALNNAGQNFAKPKDQLAASVAIKHLDDYLAAIPEKDVLAGDAQAASSVLRDAIGNSAAGFRSDRVTGKLEQADLNAAAANSGRNIGNAIRQRVKSLVLSDKESSGLNAAELAQAERVVRGTRSGNTARVVGNLLGGGGGLGSVAAAAAGGFATGGWGALAPLAGAGIKQIENASVKRQARILDEMIRSRSPAAASMMANTSQAGQLPPAVLARLLLSSQEQQQ